MLRGLSTVSFFADDVEAAQAWYAELLGIEPYFVRPDQGPPAYVEFRIGDYQHELGIIDRRFAPHERPDKAAGAVSKEFREAHKQFQSERQCTNLAREGKYAEAIDHFRAALALDPNNSDARGYLARATQLLEAPRTTQPPRDLF